MVSSPDENTNIKKVYRVLILLFFAVQICIFFCVCMCVCNENCNIFMLFKIHKKKKKKKKYAETRLNDKIHAQHKKNAFMPYANSEDPDEHAHPVQSDLDILFVDM